MCTFLSCPCIIIVLTATAYVCEENEFLWADIVCFADQDSYHKLIEKGHMHKAIAMHIVLCMLSQHYLFYFRILLCAIGIVDAAKINKIELW